MYEALLAPIAHPVSLMLQNCIRKIVHISTFLQSHLINVTF